MNARVKRLRRIRGIRVLLACVLAGGLLLCLVGVPSGQAEAATKGSSRLAAVKIAKKSVAKAKITLSTTSYVYNGKARKPKVTVRLSGKKLSASKDYRVSYKNNTKAGKAYAVVKGKGSYTGTCKKAFRIAKRSLAKSSVALSKASYIYDGKAKKPSARVKVSGKALRRNSNYSLGYENNVNAGIASAVIRGTGNYCGTVVRRFTIARRSIKGASITISPATCAYTGHPQRPPATVKRFGRLLRQGSDYTLSYANNVAMGSATLTVRGQGNYCGTAAKKFKIGEPILRQWVGVAQSQGGAQALMAIPTKLQVPAIYGLAGSADKKCSLALDGRTLAGTWKLESVNENARTYHLSLTGATSWLATWYSTGEVRVTNLANPNQVLVFR